MLYNSCRRPTGLEQSSTSRPILIVSHRFSARTENIPVPLQLRQPVILQSTVLFSIIPLTV